MFFFFYKTKMLSLNAYDVTFLTELIMNFKFDFGLWFENYKDNLSKIDTFENSRE